MKKQLSTFLIFFLCIGLIYAQEDKKDTTRVDDYSEEIASFNNVSEGQEDADTELGNYVPGVVQTRRDAFVNNTSYAFSIAYFKTRGFDNRFQDICLNGLPMNSLVTGRASYSQWGGLSHVVRYPETSIGLTPPSFSFGNFIGTVNYSLRASSYRQQVRASYALSNKTYTNRIMITGATGVLKNGWSVAGSLSTRFGNSLAYVDGTFYKGLSYFFATEKQFNREHALNLTIFGAPTTRGMQGNSVQEVYDLLGTNYYNPNWGWYNGEKRNARVRTVHEPVILLSHYYTPEKGNLEITTTLASTFGRNNTTSLNWYDVPDPRPDYYRYLPSYFINKDNPDDTFLYDYYTEAWKNDASLRQINWDYMYNVNQTAAAMGNRAQYMIENRVYDHFQMAGSSSIIANLTEHIKLTAGINVRGMKQRNYKTIADLLGGSYWLDVDKYSEGDFPDEQNVPYNDLDNVDKKLYEGDVFGYDYTYHIYYQQAWALANFTYNKVDFFAGLDLNATEFWRVGNMQNGRFPDDSKGKSAVQSFLNIGGKAGVTYKINGRNYLVLNGQYSTKAPSILNAFLAPRVRNTYVSNLKNEKIGAAEFSYVMHYPIFKMRITGYYAYFKDITKLISFYHDDYASMVNYSMSGIDQRNIGVEFGAEVALGSMFTLYVAGNWGDYRYANRPEVAINAENGYDILDNNNSDVTQTVYWKNFHVAGSPQLAITGGLKFNYNYWWVTINGNWFDKIYCDINPERRTSAARGSLDENSELYHQIADQKRYKGQFTLDLSVSKSWRVGGRYSIGFNVSINNLLNNKKLITTAWEQYRFDYSTFNVDKYQPKVYYAFGTSFFAGINFTFN